MGNESGEKMISKKVTHGYIGVNTNYEEKYVLLNCTYGQHQMRLTLTPKEAFDLAQDLIKYGLICYDKESKK